MAIQENVQADEGETAAARGQTAELAAFTAALEYDDLPPEVIAQAKLLILDGIGCGIFGAGLEWTRMVADFALSEGARPVASVFGSGRKSSKSLAALANATAGHAFELDDIHRESVLHPNSLAVPVSLAYAEEDQSLDGRQFLTAVIAGYEVGTRVGNAATTSLFLRGFHPQGTSGAFVAATSAGRLAGLPAEQMLHALAISGSQAAGLMAAQEGAMVKRMHAGRAAQSGVYAAELAARGFTGITNVLEADYGGFLSAFSGNYNLSALTAGLGSRWQVLETGFKPHASVTSIHTALDALRLIMDRHQLEADDIERVIADVGTMTHVHCAWPYVPNGVTAAQMNLYYGLSVVALEGAAFIDQFSEDRIADEAILEFTKRVEANIDPEIDAKGPAYRHACRLTVITRSGERYSEDMPYRKGSPENPLSTEEVLNKFRKLATSRLSDGAAKTIANTVLNLEDASSLAPLCEILGAAY